MGVRIEFGAGLAPVMYFETLTGEMELPLSPDDLQELNALAAAEKAAEDMVKNARAEYGKCICRMRTKATEVKKLGATNGLDQTPEPG